MREVDVSIRCKVGTAEILVTVECRRQSRKVDVRWIEELSSKRDALGISKVVAVSARGFSKDAIDSAGKCGIELRVISEIGPDAIRGWFLPDKITFTRRCFDIHSVELEVKDEAPVGGSSHTDIAVGPSTTSEIFESIAGQRLSLNQIFSAALDQNQSLNDGISSDGSRIRKKVRMTFNPGELSLNVNGVTVGIAGIVVSVDLWDEGSSRDGSGGSFHEYRDLHRGSIQRAEFTVTNGPDSLRFGMQHALGEQGIKVSIERLNDSTEISTQVPLAKPSPNVEK